MKWIRERVRSGAILSGLWVSTGSSVVAEIAGHAGADWVLLDSEHGLGDDADLVHSLQALRGTEAAAIVRIPGLEPYLIKRALDRGASGIMVPWVNSAEEATAIVRAMRYPPDGIRGVAGGTPATRFGADPTYLSQANERLLTVVQIETPEAVSAADAIAAVEGVDVLFVGPSDLSFSMGIHQQIDHPDFRAAIERVRQACSVHNKQAGILASSPKMVQQAIEDGFTFIAYGIDTKLLTGGMHACVQTIVTAGNSKRTTLDNAFAEGS